MRSHEEVFESIKRRTLQYEQQKRKPRKIRRAFALAVPVTVIALGLTVTMGVQFGWFGKKQQTGTEVLTPTAEVSATPEVSPDVSPEPTEPVTPAPTAEPTPTGEPGRFAVIKLDPTPTPVVQRSDSPEPTPEGVTEEVRAKIAKELSYLEGSDEKAWVYISPDNNIGNYWFRTLYPNEYGACYLKWFSLNRPLMEWEMDFSHVDKQFMENWEKTVLPGLSQAEFDELYARGLELSWLPWMQDQMEEMIQKYPELAKVPQGILDNARESGTETDYLSYREMLERALSPAVGRIVPYDNSLERSGRRVVGLYQGKKVYNAFKADFFYYADTHGLPEAKPGVLYDCISQLGLDDIGNDEYLLISIQFDPDWDKAKAMLREKYSAPTGNDDSLVEWLTGEEGQAALKEVSEELTKDGYEKIWSFGWPVLAEETLPATGSAGFGRCVSVLATKAQLLSFVPELPNTKQADWWAYNIGTQSADPNSVMTLYFTGSVANVQNMGRLKVD